MGNPTCAWSVDDTHTGDLSCPDTRMLGGSRCMMGVRAGCGCRSRAAESPPSLIIQHSLQREKDSHDSIERHRR